MPGIGETFAPRMETNASSIDVCRLCAQSSDPRSFIPLYTEDKRERIVAKQINQLVANLISPDDGLPQKICSKCSKNVETCYSFVCNVIETQHKLKRLKRAVIDHKRKRVADDESAENYRSFARIRCEVEDVCQNEGESNAVADDFIELLVVHPEEMVEVDVNGMLDDSQRFVQIYENGKTNARDVVAGVDQITCADPLSRFKEECDENSKFDNADAVASSVESAEDQRTLLVIESNRYQACDERDDNFSDAIAVAAAAIKEEPKEITFTDNYENEDADVDVADAVAISDEILELQEAQHVTWVYEDSPSHKEDTSMLEDECDIVYKCESCANTYENEALFQAHSCGDDDDDDDRYDYGYTDGGSVNASVGEACSKGRNILQCDVCDRIFKSKFVFKLHYAQHKKSNVCQLCNACFLDSEDLQTHLNQMHSGVNSHVDDNAVALSSASMDMYEESMGDSQKQCDVCGKITDNLKQHKLYHAIRELEYCKAENKKFLKKWFYCQKCNKKIFSEANYLFHVAKHNGADTVHCRQCDYVAVNIQDYNMHITTHTGGKYFICNDCEKCFFTRSAISDHVLIHMDGTRYMCEICGKRFKTSRSNAQHKLLQHKKYFRCNRCNRGFTHEAKLKSHYNICRVINQDQKESKVFEPVEKFFCNICNSNIKSSSEISILFHKAKHEGKDGVECKICKLLCKNACMYKNHLLKHTNQRPYACTQCPKSFRTKGCLVQHMLVHGDEYKYTCEHCGKKSKKLTTHVNHVNIHTNTKPYKCPDCDRPFRQLSDMKKHRRTHLKYKNDSTAAAAATAMVVTVAAADADAATTVDVTDQLPDYLTIKTEVEDIMAVDNIQQLQLT